MRVYHLIYGKYGLRALRRNGRPELKPNWFLSEHLFPARYQPSGSAVGDGILSGRAKLLMPTRLLPRSCRTAA
jgi:hypothetical protein